MGFSQALQKRVKIRFAVKYILAASASTHHMITDDFVYDAKWASHAVENYRILIVKSRFDKHKAASPHHRGMTVVARTTMTVPTQSIGGCHATLLRN